MNIIINIILLTDIQYQYTMYLQNIMEYYNLQYLGNKIECKNFIEFELKLLADYRLNKPRFLKNNSMEIDTLKQLFKYFQNVSEEVNNVQTMNFIKSVKDNTTKNNLKKEYSLIKELVFINGIQDKNKKRFYKKQKLHSPMFIANNSYDFKISLNQESDCDQINDYDLIRIKQRFRFTIDNWFIDFTFIKTTNSKITDELKNYRDKMFVDINENSIFDSRVDIWEYAEVIEIEMEYNNNVLKLSDLKFIIDSVTKFSVNEDSIKSDDVSKHNILEKLYAIISKKQNKIQQKNHKNTLKKILPNAVEINKAQYFKDILPVINEFYITEKADGIRTIFIINDHIAYYNTSYTLIGSNADIQLKETIFECEFINDTFYIFDVIKYDGENVAMKIFTERYKILLEFEKLINEYVDKINSQFKNLRVKKSYELTTETYSDIIRNMYNNPSSDYNVDGLIFTSKNSSYIDTKFYKWKDVKNMTIDFYVKKCPQRMLGLSPYVLKPGHDLYLLFSGIQIKEYRQFNMKKLQSYKEMFPTLALMQYFPIQFSPSDNQYAFLYWHPKNTTNNTRIKQDSNLDGKIAELRYDNGWKFVRERHDRYHDITKKNYYGNHFRVAELIWRNYSNPLTIDLLCSSIEEVSHEFYFKVSNSSLHLAARHYNNIVKERILHSLDSSSNSNVIDLGGGKGQDLLKYSSMKSVSTVLFIDNNENNLCEIIHRKHDKLFNNGKYSSLKILIQNINLNDNYSSNYEQITSVHCDIHKMKTKFVVCNFAVHYFVKNVTTMSNFVNLVNLLMPVDSYFIVTYMDGEKVYDLLKNSIKSNAKFYGDGEKYMIKPKDLNTFNKSKRFIGGEEIELLLPFSNNDLFSEYLVNSNLLTRVLKQKKITLYKTGLFSE
ncbi:MAG: hypothetical protein ACRCZI_05945, partial [Cetobacterium sp.]